MKPFFAKLFLLGAFSFCTASLSFAETWKASCEIDFPPYNFQDKGKNIGMDTEIVELVARKMEDVQINIEASPWVRVIKTLENGEANLAWQFVDSPERREKFILVGPIREGKTVFIVPKDSPIKDWSTLETFKGKTFGVVRGFKYTPEFDSSTFFEKQETVNNKKLVQLIAKNRIEIAIGDFNTLTYEAKAGGFIDEVRFLSKPLKQVPRYVGFNKKDADKANKFEAALKKVVGSPEYNSIIDKYSKTK